HSNHLTPSTLSLACRVLPERPPGCIGDGKGQTMVVDHVGHMQIFSSSRLVALYVVAGGFVKGILALVREMFMDTRYLLFRFLPVCTALLALCKPFLSFGKPFSGLPGMLGI